MRRYFSLVIMLLTMLLAPFVYAQNQTTPPSPVPMLQDLSDKMIAALKQNKASMQKNPDIVFGIVHKILLPHADLQAMARAALGRDAWISATPKQQGAFVDAFTDLMIRTYGAGLSSYNDQKVQFAPIRGGLQPGQDRVEIQSQIVRTDGPPISVSYRLVYQNNDWKVYDFSVEGISMIQSFRSQFAADISAGANIETLTQKIKTHNASQDPKHAAS